MVPLRPQLIVKEHGNLSFPEGTGVRRRSGCGRARRIVAGRVFWDSVSAHLHFPDEHRAGMDFAT